VCESGAKIRGVISAKLDPSGAISGDPARPENARPPYSGDYRIKPGAAVNSLAPPPYDLGPGGAAAAGRTTRVGQSRIESPPYSGVALFAFDNPEAGR